MYSVKILNFLKENVHLSLEIPIFVTYKLF